MKKILLISLCLLPLLLLSCNKKAEETIVFDKSQPLALAPDVYWAVVTDPYAAYKEEYGWQSTVKGHCRKGDILQVIGKSEDSNNEVWYLFENGWLPENCLGVYSNRYKAQAVSDKLLGVN
ncbi:MAG: hypothetical protein K6C97_06405 [Treponema sp.]|nr:hypothetical protein [Treponema sp.]